MDLAVLVGQGHDDGLVDDVGRVGVSLQQVCDVVGIHPGARDADVDELLLFYHVGDGNVVAQRALRQANRQRSLVILPATLSPAMRNDLKVRS